MILPSLEKLSAIVSRLFAYLNEYVRNSTGLVTYQWGNIGVVCLLCCDFEVFFATMSRDYYPAKSAAIAPITLPSIGGVALRER